MIRSSELDVICVVETFLNKDNEIHLEGYKWFGNNRKNISKRAVRGSGGGWHTC